VSVEDDEHSGLPSISKTTENIKEFESSSTKTVAEQSVNSQTPLGPVMEFEDLNRKFEYAPHWSFIAKARPPTGPWKLQNL
jgi:hypothetical protein